MAGIMFLVVIGLKQTCLNDLSCDKSTLHKSHPSIRAALAYTHDVKEAREECDQCLHYKEQQDTKPECTRTFQVSYVHHTSVQWLSHVPIFATPWTAARQASLSTTNSQSLLKLMSIELVVPSNHLILCRPLLLPPSIFPSIRVFSNESVLHIRWPKYWSFRFSVSPSDEYSGLISFTKHQLAKISHMTEPRNQGWGSNAINLP